MGLINLAKLLVLLTIFLATGCKRRTSESEPKEVKEIRTTEANPDRSSDISYRLVAQRPDDIKIIEKNMSGSSISGSSYPYTVRVRTKDARPYRMQSNSYFVNFKGFWSKAISRDTFVDFDIDGPATWQIGQTLKELIVCEKNVALANPTLARIAEAEDVDFILSSDWNWNATLGKAIEWDGREFSGEHAHLCP
jgi:hypothetical protein